MGIAADSWLAYMDRLLTLGDDRASEKNLLKTKMLKLIDVYYDALDAPKSGKKVCFVYFVLCLMRYLLLHQIYLWMINLPAILMLVQNARIFHNVRKYKDYLLQVNRL